ncbi:amidohydrolase family protein [Rhodobacterales bacterium HKCCE2091]|nr:amidohydrolase family protein [Rhodobacterales bacterium HKCCE2091]
MERVHDIHPHIISGDNDCYPRSPLGGKQSDWAKEHVVTWQDMIEAMDAAGIACAALVQSSTCYGYDYSYILDAVAARPDRFTAIATIDVTAPDAVATVERLVARGVSGLRIYTGGSKLAFSYDVLKDPAAAPVWEFCGAAGLPICLQVRSPAFPIVARLAAQFPKTRIALDHLARADITDGPPYAAAKTLFDLADHGNIYLKATPRTFDLASSGAATPETFFPKLVSVFGADRVAFGSNYPSIKGPLSDIVARARECLSSLTSADRAMILSGTSEILYPALAAKSAVQS